MRVALLGGNDYLIILGKEATEKYLGEIRKSKIAQLMRQRFEMKPERLEELKTKRIANVNYRLPGESYEDYKQRQKDRNDVMQVMNTGKFIASTQLNRAQRRRKK